MDLGFRCGFHRTRRPAILLGFLLHTSFFVLIDFSPQLVAFELEMLALYVLFASGKPGSGTLFGRFLRSLR
jgi:hypothetical protein